LLFSGTVFYVGAATARSRSAASPGTLEADYRLPVRVWRETMDHYFPNAHGCGSTATPSSASSPSARATR
jgi:hypothetical protein